MRSVLALCLLVSTLALAGASARADDLTRTITVTGTGEISVAPDMATIVVGVQSEGEAAAAALDEASAATLAILARLDVEGVDPADIRSGAIRLQPRYSNSVLSSGQQIVIGNGGIVDRRDVDRDRG